MAIQLQVMAKTKELSLLFRYITEAELHTVAAHTMVKCYEIILECCEVPVDTVQSIVKKYKEFHTVKNEEAQTESWTCNNGSVKGQESKDVHQWDPDETLQLCYSHLQADTPVGTQRLHLYSRADREKKETSEQIVLCLK